MDRLPDEILVDILDYLDSDDVIACQRVSPRLLKLARDRTLWRYKCFEKAPSATAFAADRPNALTALTNALGGLSISEPSQSASMEGYFASKASARAEIRSRISRRAQAVADWDSSHQSERVDWYSEYIARHAPLTINWNTASSSSSRDIRGLAYSEELNRVVGPLDDGSLCIWNLQESTNGCPQLDQSVCSRPGILFADYSASPGSSVPKGQLSFGGAVECISVDSSCRKSYIAIENTLNELDLETMTVVSQSSYAWPITALSQGVQPDVPLTIGTSWSLHLYDPRIPLRDRSRSPEDLLRKVPADPEDSIAFLPNYSKGQKGLTGYLPSAGQLPTTRAPTVNQLAEQLRRPRPARRSDLSDYACIEPGPQSILHHGVDEILIAGRFPSILSYDRRYFPRLQYVMHSGARLSAITSMPFPPRGAGSHSATGATLVACGEYGGRGSLEVYSLPQVRKLPRGSSTSPSDSNTFGGPDREHSLAQASMVNENPYSYKNRQEASSSKLLSVAAQGTRIVFSDAEGVLKWVERDGRGLVRKWNINTYQMSESGGQVSGEQVIRKIVPLPASDSAQGSRGDGDLLIWTGEKIGIVTTKPKYDDHEELAKAFDDRMNLNGDDLTEKEMVDEYSRTMRMALERQADERRWMSRFGLKR